MLALIDLKHLQIDGTGVSTQEAIMFLGVCIVFAAFLRGFFR